MNIKSDSRKIVPGDTFIALEYVNDGHKYVMDAIKRGATKVIVKEGLYSVDTLVVKDTHEYLVNYLKENYSSQISDLKLIGMTGTNGKTTTCYLLHKMLNKLGEKCAYIGTLGFYIDEKIKDLNNTTPDILELYEMLLESKIQGCKYVVMEVSSHALSLDRVKGLEFDVACFSNLTQDHLDYHITMENYLNEKMKLFRMLKHDRIAVINNDDDYGEKIMMENNKNITYGFTDSNYKITSYKTSLLGSSFTINDKDIYETKLLGCHNIYNLTCIISVLSILGYEYDDCYKFISELESPPGRMDSVIKDTNIIIIDYAHTPDAIRNVLGAVKELNPRHIYTIVGCGGDRDRSKRAKMADLATSLSDYVIFTSDNPRTEDPVRIIDDMIQKLDKNNYEIEVNREKAIIKGIQLLEENDILMVLGKGHESYQIIGMQKIDFDDKKIVIDNI
ncbi:MAG: UDP-N-acetylmuramoyl-L-alanyl-D-glutamate--2,6-diaminopimelate ligase [Firmicutes bacterium]|nr:UDP-N-acetylmuramoyl-L-alanyl-D-glutamate--2,6-diaminopimelate ligase [Bacillota bacterium]